MVSRFIREVLNTFSCMIDPPKSNDKRNVLIIHVHPVPESFSTAISSVLKSCLLRQGHEVRLRKLYFHGNELDCYNGKSFDPVLTCEERRKYLDSDLINLRKRSDISTQIPVEIQQAIADLRWCNSIIFIYPTWWFNLPAMLKGYIDRVFLAGVAFDLPKDKDGKVHFAPYLTHITKIGVITTYGSTFPTVCYAGDNGRQFFSRGLRPVLAPRCQLQWNGLYDMDNVTEEQRKLFLLCLEETYKQF